MAVASEPFFDGALTDSEAATFQAAAEARLTETGRVGRNAGGTFFQIAANVPMAAFSGKVMSDAAGNFVAFCLAIQAPLGSDIQPGDQIVKNGLLFDVEGTNAGLTAANVLTIYAYRLLTAPTW